jgi:hypothetical protein
MSLIGLLCTAICQTWEHHFGKFQVKQDVPKAMRVTFSTSINYDTESGYRYVDLAIFAPMNYVGVWVRERWTVIPLEDLEGEDGDEHVKKGKSYNEGHTPWRRVAYHDSCWREGVEQVIKDHQNEILTFNGPSFFSAMSPQELPEP